MALFYTVLAITKNRVDELSCCCG